MIVNPIVSIALVVVLLGFSVYLATWPRRSGSMLDALDDDMPLAEMNGSSRIECEQPLVPHQKKRGLCV
ncbi:hypothetical protein AvCA_02180 [Azotobacter vinelandii CA]|uniref:Uncharacterized protein n=2 Tax=Azotobacter vinelandii TaxID=354 RepID=C1DH72_AZOVD|nr:hypothetical protein [Azotobacter vinelandii]ACO76479.1 hypothetical protein Avin_02180 [Azotobacter vinelandii DJ]AGK17386.1 hypothetical protein AvCA_02180 [Azotobacter vinelandii CA]AGK19151.1 hypothetical protein AvCA6_02180 [Azotobacter vinelandii CA6]WKN22254.1 hypothetical protein AVAEIV_000213 [Azotobacter vinelandii]SFX08899.1 hypothetical protein SAMN04244547_00341 [Azotobacter vinelandii]